MSLHSWLHSFRSALAPGRGQRQLRRRGVRRAATHRPNLEVLEDRSVPAFLAPIYYATGASSNAVVTADFNDDGHLDLATANHGSNDVSVLLGNGDGTFQSARIFATTGSPVWIEAGDFNGDGKLDLVTGNYVWYGDESYNEFSTLLGNGDGSFQWIGNSTAGGGNYQDVALGDVNGDGKLDVATTMNGGFTSGGEGESSRLWGTGTASSARRLVTGFPASPSVPSSRQISTATGTRIWPGPGVASGCR
jgi:hypothetical protein